MDSYPAQRLLGISVDVPSSTFIERVVPVKVYPEWPSGTGTVAIFATGSSGDPNSVLAAVAGGTDGVSLSSSCAPSVVVTAAGLVSAGERLAYALCRPPGHHVTRAAYGGSCYLNNAAIAAQVARALVERR